MRIRLSLMALATALTLTACGGGTDATSSTSADATAETTAAAVTAAFGAPVDLGGGVSITVTTPAAFTPGDFASNYLPGQAAEIFDVTLTNGGTAALDPSSISLAPTTSGSFCTDVLDGDNGVNGAPTEPIEAGASVTFKYGVACDAKAGDPLSLDVSYGETAVSLTGTLA